MNARAGLAAAVLLLCAPAGAGLRCPGGGKPGLQPHPFRPLVCPSAADPAALPSDTFTVTLKDAPAPDAGPLQGAWEGWVTYGFERWEVLLTLKRGRQGWRGRLEAREHRTLKHLTLEGSAAGGKLVVRFEGLAEPRGEGEARHGAPQGEPYDHALLVSVGGRPSQELLLKREGGTLKVRYLDLARPGLGEAETELKRSKRKKL